MELVIAGNVYLDGGINKCCIGIEDGKIAAIKKVLKGDKFYDFNDKLILPAGTDIHVHFRDPGLTYKEDFETGTESAAFGGISCVVDMPNTIPPVTDPESLEEKLNAVKKRSYIDFGLYTAITGRTDLNKVAPKTTGFKLFLGETTGKLTFGDLNELRKKLASFKHDRPIVLAVHAEQSRVLSDARKKVPDEQYKNLTAHSRRRPPDAETRAIDEMLDFYNAFDHSISTTVKLHFCHLSSGNSLDLLENRKGISSEVTPHHFLLNTETNMQLGTFGKVNPPVRSEEDRSRLWLAFCNGQIPIVASDHAPHTISEKEVPFAEAPSGIPGVETTIPLLLSRLKHGSIGIERFVNATSTSPAKLFGFNKGEIGVGKDGDLMVVDMRKEESLKTKMLHSKCGWTPYGNMSVIFPVMTVSHGRVVVKDGNLEGDRGTGRYLL